MPEKIEVDFDKLKERKRKNFQERIWFIKFWVEYMKTHSDKEWSEAQRKLIDAQFSGLEKKKD
jgi:hypothetical protein